MEDSLVALVNDALVAPQAGRRAEGAATDPTGELQSTSIDYSGVCQH